MVNEARNLAKQDIANVSRGIDLLLEQKEKAKKQKQENEAPTVMELATEFLERYIKVNRKDPNEVERMYKKDVLPSIGGIKLKDIIR